MFTGQVIYILEIALCVLSGALFLLIGIKYREYLRAEERLAELIAKREVAASKHSKPKNTVPSSAALRVLSDLANMRAKAVEEPALPLMEVEDSEDIIQKPLVSQSALDDRPGIVATLPESRAVDDLNDYIGGFFSTPSSAASSTPASFLPSQHEPTADLCVAEQVLQNEVVPTVSAEVSSEVDDEDSFIVVEEDLSSELKGKSRVMSHRVVRSMLDEASIA